MADPILFVTALPEGFLITNFKKEHYWVNQLPDSKNIFCFQQEIPKVRDLAVLAGLFWFQPINELINVNNYITLLPLLNEKLNASLRSAQIVGLDLKKYTLPELINWSELLVCYSQRNLILFQIYKELAESVKFKHLLNFYDNFIFPIVQPLIKDIETNGLCIDKDFNFESDIIKNIKSQAQENNLIFPKFNFYNETGRLSASYRLFSLPKDETRKIIKSRFPAGLIVSFDYIAMEVCIAFKLAKIKLPKQDLYQYFYENLFNRQGDRKLAKRLAVIWLYADEPGKVVKKHTQADLLIKNLQILQKTFPEIKEYKIKLWQQWSRDGFILNEFGRRLEFPVNTLPNLVLSHMVQSTAVDFALDRFHVVQQFIKSLKLQSKIIMPWHDALILDFYPNEKLIFEYIPGILQLPVKTKIGPNLYDLVELKLPPLSSEVPF